MSRVFRKLLLKLRPTPGWRGRSIDLGLGDRHWDVNHVNPKIAELKRERSNTTLILLIHIKFKWARPVGFGGAPKRLEIETARGSEQHCHLEVVLVCWSCHQKTRSG